MKAIAVAGVYHQLRSLNDLHGPKKQNRWDLKKRTMYAGCSMVCRHPADLR